MMTVISAPGDLIIATSQGIDVRFAGIELTTDLPVHPESSPERGIRISLEGIRDQETQHRDQGYVEALLRWVEQRKAQGAGPGRPTCLTCWR